jgi:hypothetical protein
MAAAAVAARNDFRDIVLVMVGLSNTGNVNNQQTKRFTTLHNLTSLASFTQVMPHQAKDLVKQFTSRYNNEGVSVIALNNLTGLIWWIMDQKRCQQVPIIADLTEDDLIAGHAAYEEYLINKDKGESMKGIPRFDPKVDFDDWDKLVTETLSMIHGAQYTGIAYGIRPDNKPAGWNPITDANTDYERLLYQTPLHGPKYEVDNASVFTLIYMSVLEMPAFTWVEVAKRKETLKAASNQ